MPLFDVGTERSPLVVLSRPEQSAFDADARALVQEHLPALLGGKAFTIVGGAHSEAEPRPPSGATLALDAAGSTVVVVVASTVGEAELVAALGEAGRASRLTRTQLADLYPAGPERFHKDVTDFYASLPVGRWPQPGHGAVRLVVVCAEVTQDAQDALAFLRGTGSALEVLLVGDVPAEPGRRLVDVSPFTAAPSGARTPVLVGRISAPVRPMQPVVAQPTGPVRTSAFGTPSFPPVPIAPSAVEMTTILPPVRATDYPVYSEPPVEEIDRREPSVRRTGRSPLSAPLPAVELPAPGTPYTPIFLSVPDMLSALPERPSDAPVLDQAPRATLDLAVAPDDATGYVAGPGEAAAWEGSGTGLTGRSAYRASAFIAAKKYIPEKLDREPRRTPAPVVARVPEVVHAGRTAARLDAPVSRSLDDPTSLSFDEPGSPFWAELSAQFAEPVRFDPPDPHDPPDRSEAPAPSAPADINGPTDAALTALAAELHSSLPLVWVRHRRGERFEALLHPDGTLETSDGLRFADPSWAAISVSGTAAADGWRVWRAGESGPTLAELRG